VLYRTSASPGFVMPRLLSLFTALLLLAAPALAAPVPLLVCAADAQLPPFTYSQHNRTIGMAVDLLARLLKEAGLPAAQVEMLPWRRCLALVQSGRYALALNAATAQVDPAPFLVTEPYVQLNSVYLYSSRYFSSGLSIKQLDDLHRYRVCGLMGHTFESYGLDNAKVDVGAANYPQLIAKLHAGHCDLFLDKREVIAALHLVDTRLKDMLTDGSLQIRPVPEEAPVGLHFLVSRRIKQAVPLRNALDAGIQRLIRNKAMQGLQAPYQGAVKH